MGLLLLTRNATYEKKKKKDLFRLQYVKYDARIATFRHVTRLKHPGLLS